MINNYQGISEVCSTALLVAEKQKGKKAREETVEQLAHLSFSQREIEPLPKRFKLTHQRDVCQIELSFKKAYTEAAQKLFENEDEKTFCAFLESQRPFFRKYPYLINFSLQEGAYKGCTPLFSAVSFRLWDLAKNMLKCSPQANVNAN